MGKKREGIEGWSWEGKLLHATAAVWHWKWAAEDIAKKRGRGEERRAKEGMSTGRYGNWKQTQQSRLSEKNHQHHKLPDTHTHTHRHHYIISSFLLSSGKCIIIRGRKSCPLCEVKVKESSFAKMFRIFAKLFFLIKKIPLLGISLGNIFASETCSWNLTWAGQNVQWKFQISRLSLIGRAHQCSRSIWKITFTCLLYDRKCIVFSVRCWKK